MTPSEAAQALAKASAFDNRQVSETAAYAWAEVLATHTLDEVSQAIAEHYANSTAFVLPGHIAAIIKARRDATDLRQIPATDPPSALADQPQAEQQWILTYKRAIADGADEPTARRIACRAHDTTDDDRPELNPAAARELTQAITNITDAKRSKRARPKETA